MSAPRTEVARILRDAAGLLRTKGWTQEYFARDEEGSEIDPSSLGATCFCATGAVAAVLGPVPTEPTRDTAEEALRVLALAILDGDEERLGRRTPEFIVEDWNDTPGRTVDEVLAMFERAASALEGR